MAICAMYIRLPKLFVGCHGPGMGMTVIVISASRNNHIIRGDDVKPRSLGDHPVDTIMEP